jgi:uncharacterized protein (TIGR02145 family)
MKKALLILVIISICISCKKDNPTDPNNSNSGTVTIGTQVWMNRNLDVDHYRNGDPIPEVQDSAIWNHLTTGAWCYYNNDPAIGAIYGKLYNWYAVNDPRGLAPTGWHVPTDAEWTTLTTYLVGENVAGGKLKESGTSHWTSPNTGATNETGFSSLPGGYRNYFGAFTTFGIYGYWWSSTENYASYAWSRTLYYNYAGIYRYNNGYYNNKVNGFSVRSIKDN